MYVVKQNFCCSLKFITRLFDVGERERGWDERERVGWGRERGRTSFHSRARKVRNVRS